MTELTELWNLLFIKPMLNSLIVLSGSLFHSFGLAIILFTIVIRLIITPLTLKQLHASKAMSALQPKLQELQKKYAKDKQRLSQETMRLYKEQGVSPMGCLGPMVVQMPIWFGLYQVIMKALATTPEGLVDLYRYLYSWPIVHQLVPIKEQFLWLNLAKPDTWVLPVLVGVSMWVQQKMTMLPGGDPRQQSMNRMMLWMMPIMFGLFTMQFPSGLAIFWVVSNLVGIATQYFVAGWGGLTPAANIATTPSPVGIGKRIRNGEPRKPEEAGKPRVQRQNRRRSYKASTGKSGAKTRRGGDKHTEKG